jgi:hypothetical protein
MGRPTRSDGSGRPDAGVAWPEVDAEAAGVERLPGGVLRVHHPFAGFEVVAVPGVVRGAAADGDEAVVLSDSTILCTMSVPQHRVELLERERFDQFVDLHGASLRGRLVRADAFSLGSQGKAGRAETVRSRSWNRPGGPVGYLPVRRGSPRARSV